MGIPATYIERASGILLHITSLPSRYGVGDFGGEARAFIDALSEAGQKLWQVLPLAPTGYGNSPYSSYSAFAISHLLISPELLCARGYVDKKELDGAPEFPADRVDYEAVYTYKNKLFTAAYRRFIERADAAERAAFGAFCESERHWLDDYTLFMALKKNFKGIPWNEWEEPIRLRHPHAVAHYRHSLTGEIHLQQYLQFECNRQWSDLKKYAAERRVKIIGDIPIFLAYDSADVWANRDMFRLRSDGSPEVVTGVPPDYFSEKGQLWGNPHYNWKAMAARDFDWWKLRFARMFALYDLVRIDHFRGFEASFEIKAGAEDATKGRWKKVPGKQLFASLVKHFGALPVLAEDLGMITEEVHELRRHFRFPGMRVLQFGYGSGETNNYFLPHNFTPDSIVYTGTHDNDTTAGWYTSLPNDKKHFLHQYLQTTGAENICRALVREALASTAVLAVVPVQDILALGTESRMNLPGRADGNWEYRLASGAITPEHIAQLRLWAYLYHR